MIQHCQMRKTKTKRRRRVSAGNWLGLPQLEAEYEMSRDFWRRATKALVDPLPCVRLGLGDPRCARILVHRAEAEAWLRRRRDAAQVRLQDVVNDIARKVTAA
jgi:hypothetical protein